MKIYNTMSRKKEELKTITQGEVKIYACGPTVYNYIHIGNARPLCVFDTFRRYLEYRGYKAVSYTHLDVYKRQARSHRVKPHLRCTLWQRRKSSAARLHLLMRSMLCLLYTSRCV